MFHLLRFLGSRFRVDLIAPAIDGWEESQRLLQGLCAETIFVPPRGPSLLDKISLVSPYAKDRALAAAVRERLTSRVYRAVHVETQSMMSSLPAQTAVPVVLDLWSDDLPRPLRILRSGKGTTGPPTQLARRLKQGLFDRWCWPATSCLTVVSEEDRMRCEAAHPGQRVVVVPNGVDCQAIRPKPDQAMAAPVLLFTGDMSAESNVDAAMVLATEVFPSIRREFPKAELRLVGRAPDPRVMRLAAPGLTVTGDVPDMQVHLRAATIYVAPHFTHSGMRTKLLEAMAAGLPIITTSLAIEGIKVQPGRDLLVADQPADMIESIQTLLASQPDRERFAQAARHMAEVWYDWDRCLWPLEPLYHELLAPTAVAC